MLTILAETVDLGERPRRHRFPPALAPWPYELLSNAHLSIHKSIGDSSGSGVDSGKRRAGYLTAADIGRGTLIRTFNQLGTRCMQVACSLILFINALAKAVNEDMATLGETNCCKAASISAGRETLISKLSWLLPSLALVADPCPAPTPAARPLAVSPRFCVERSFSSTRESRTNSSWCTCKYQKPRKTSRPAMNPL